MEVNLLACLAMTSAMSSEPQPRVLLNPSYDFVLALRRDRKFREGVSASLRNGSMLRKEARKTKLKPL